MNPNSAGIPKVYLKALRVRQVIVIPKASALFAIGHPDGLARGFDVSVAEDHVGLAVVPVADSGVAPGRPGRRRVAVRTSASGPGTAQRHTYAK